ncbi:MAG TPA: Flp pilus assembly protein CpaB [Methylocella sp.]|nr:Flp pilus assembly protein CpaB [Methylocella sp.]
MFLRNVLLALGIVFVLAGLALMTAWLRQPKTPPAPALSPAQPRAEVLAAARPIPEGTLLRKDDTKWLEAGPGEVQPGYILRGQASEADFFGAISRKDFAEGEPLIASEFVKPGDQRFLASVLKPGTRAVTIFVDAEKSVAGLALPGDRVDVILTQTFDEKAAPDPGHRTVSETVLRDVRIVALDQTLSQPPVVSAAASALAAEPRFPRTVTLEVTERQAEILLVAAQIGKFQLAARPLENAAPAPAGHSRRARPVWASDVSAALDEITLPIAPRSCDPNASVTGSTLECLVRWPAEFPLHSAPLAQAVVTPGYAPINP